MINNFLFYENPVVHMRQCGNGASALYAGHLRPQIPTQNM